MSISSNFACSTGFNRFARVLSTSPLHSTGMCKIPLTRRRTSLLFETGMLKWHDVGRACTDRLHNCHRCRYLLDLQIDTGSLTAKFRNDCSMTRDEFFKRLQYLERPFEIHPIPQGATNNKFTFDNWDGKHIIIRTEPGQPELFLPFALIESITPGILTLNKTVRITGGTSA